VSELTWREPAGDREVLEGRQLDLVNARLTGARGALILARELDSVEQIAEPICMRNWLCTHWLT
jgi:hypothetical protein